MDKNRFTAYKVLFRIEEHDTYSNIELNNQIRKIKPDSPAFTRELTYGVIERKLYLDYILSQIAEGNYGGLSSKTKVLLRMGIFQLVFMDSVPEYAAVSETIEIAKTSCRKHYKLINRILRTFVRNREKISFPENIRKRGKRLVNQYSVDKSIVELWSLQFGYDFTEELLRASNQVPPLFIRVNTTKISKDKLAKHLISKGFEVKETGETAQMLVVSGKDILEAEEYESGLFSVQDLASVTAVTTLAPEENDFIIDVCAAPGGKSFCAAEMMGNKGKIISFDIFNQKVLNMSSQADRLGLHIVEARVGDALKLRKDLTGKADKVICDVPCSGLGVMRRKPEIKYKQIRDFAKVLADKQLRILENSAKYLKKHGRLMYSTCTVNKVENEDVVLKFLEGHEEFELKMQRQLFPNIDGTDGFYFAILERCGII
ncbi:MAG: 16S rRNA (cytosine(967)-C(5))-methyltransferase RsmB [Hornefia sp.]|nr:16S rRNA (cytosine(967)-C(5))-methyltransferase RsmB [Hornefia sp.]